MTTGVEAGSPHRIPRVTATNRKGHDPRATGWPYAEDWEWLQMAALRQVTLATLFLGWIWWMFVLQKEGLEPWISPLTVVAVGIASRWLFVRLRYRYAVCCFLAALAAAIAVIVWAEPEAPAFTLLSLLAGAAGLLVSPMLGLGLAGAISLGIGLAALRSLVPVPLAATTAGLCAAAALLARAASEPLQTVLYWSWMSYEQASEKTQELMKQRGELQRTLKDLNLAYARLEKMSGELERAREAAVEARRIKAEFAANVSHELRTPLNLIIGFSEMMFLAPQTYGGISLPAPYRGDVEAIYRSARHLSQLIDDVLDLSQVEAGRMGLTKEALSLTEVTQEAMNTVAHLFERKGLSLSLAVRRAPRPIFADRTRIRQVLMNLLNNAARFTDQGGITITVDNDDQAATVAIKDTGVGIAAADMPKVFEEFRQLDGSTRRRQGGSGLGLAISRKFVELHGGRMWVESQGIPGEGSTFFFSLPLEEDQSIALLHPAWETWARPAALSGQKAVIVVDPDERGRRIFERYLVGYHIFTVSSIIEAQRLGAKEPVHALIVVEEAGRGSAVVRSHPTPGFADVPVLSCTLQQEESLEDDLNVAAYMVKPILRERFLAVLAGLGENCQKLLLADDEPEVIRMLTRMIKSAPRRYTLRHAYDGVEAWELLQRYRPDAVVLDLLMPKMDGYALLQKMRSDPRLSDIPVIVVTAGGTDRENTSAGQVVLTRQTNLSIGELMRYLQGGLDALRPPALLHTQPMQPGGQAA